MLLIINYFSLTLSSIYIFSKILNLPITFPKLFWGILYSLTISTSLCTLIPHSSTAIPLIFIAVSLAFCVIYFKTSIEFSIITVIISYTLSYAMFYFCALFIGLLTMICFNFSTYTSFRVFIHISTCIMHLILSFLLFKHKRLRKGMPFVKNSTNNIPLLILCFLILFIYMTLSEPVKTNLFILLYFIAFLFAIFFFSYWQNSLTRTYRDKLRDRDIDILTEHVEELEEEYKKLAEDKDELAKIVHRDNKLVPAMLLSVESFLTEFSDASPEMKARGQELMAELNKEAASRKGILKQQDQKCTAKLISTGIPYLDNVLTYMQEKAMSKDIVLSASGDPGIADLVERTIEEEDLKTLAADMLENAIIANTYNHGSNVYFVIGYFGKHLAIYVYDSGIPFTKEVLLDLGIQKHTTHEADGGSGIGLMTIFELVRKYRATYIIDEYSTPTGPYTKRITIVFDKRRKYILNTSRPKEEIDFLRQRADMIIEVRKESVAK